MDVHPQTPLNTSNCTHGTPRRRKVPLLPTQPVDSIKRHLAPRIRTSESVRETLKKELSLQFDPDEWQYPLIDRILQGYDSICVAATGLGTSLMFEGVAKLAGKGKLVFSDMPVKGSRTRRVLRAQKKGFDAVAVNEDTKKTPQLFNDLKCLPLSDSLRTHAWKNDRVCRRLGAVFVDERDCAEEWGEDEFRPMYHKLSLLRPFCGYDVPFVVCTVIYLMSTFDGGFFGPTRVLKNRRQIFFLMPSTFSRLKSTIRHDLTMGRAYFKLGLDIFRKRSQRVVRPRRWGILAQ